MTEIETSKEIKMYSACMEVHVSIGPVTNLTLFSSYRATKVNGCHNGVTVIFSLESEE